MSYDSDCNSLPGGYVANCPGFANYSFLSYPVGPVFNCQSDCTAGNCASCEFFKVIDVISIVIGGTILSIGAILARLNKKNYLAWILIAVGIALIAFGFVNERYGFINP